MNETKQILTLDVHIVKAEYGLTLSAKRATIPFESLALKVRGLVLKQKQLYSSTCSKTVLTVLASGLVINTIAKKRSGRAWSRRLLYLQ